MDRKYGRNVEKILDFQIKVEEFESYINVLPKRERGQYIVGNGRVYAWLDKDDVLDLCKEKNLSKREIVAVMQEFDDGEVRPGGVMHMEVLQGIPAKWLKNMDPENMNAS